MIKADSDWGDVYVCGVTTFFFQVLQQKSHSFEVKNCPTLFKRF